MAYFFIPPLPAEKKFWRILDQSIYGKAVFIGIYFLVLCLITSEMNKGAGLFYMLIGWLSLAFLVVSLFTDMYKKTRKRETPLFEIGETLYVGVV